MNDENQAPHTSILDWAKSIVGILETEGGLHRAFYEAVNSPHLAPIRSDLLEAYADRDWNRLRRVLDTSVSRLESEITNLPPQVRKEQEQTFTVLPHERTVRFTEAEKRVHQGGAGARRKFIQSVVGRYAERFKSNKYTNPAAIEKGKTTIISALDALPETIYEGSTAQIIAEINRQVIDRCVSLGLSEDEITTLLESTRPLVEARRRTERELLESLVSSQSPDSVARSLAEDMEAGADMTRASVRQRSIRKATRFGVFDEAAKRPAPATTQTPQTKQPSGFSLTKLAKSAGKPTGLQYFLGDLFDFVGSKSALSRLVDRSAGRVMGKLVQDSNYTQFIQQSMQQMRLQEDKKPMSAASRWITNAATDVFGAVFRGPMDEAMTDYLSHHMKAGLAPHIGEFQGLLPKLIAPPSLFSGAAATSTTGAVAAGSGTIGAGAMGAGATATGAIAAGGATAGGAAAGAAAGSVVPVAGTVVGAAIGTTIGKAFGAIKSAFSFLSQEEAKKPSGFMGMPTWAWVALGIALVIVVGPFSSLTGGSSSTDLTRRLALVDPAVQGGGTSPGGPIINCGLTPDNPMCTFTPCDPSTQDCAWPTSGYITQGPFSVCGGTHRSANAIDLAGNDGAPVYATTKGTVVFTYAGCEDNKGVGGNLCGATGYKGYGNVVVIDRDAGGTLVFGHLSQQSVLLLQETLKRNGSNAVEATTQIGRVDHNGNSTGAHLHFEYRSSENINNILPIGPGKTIETPIPGCITGYSGCPACPSARVGGTQ